MLASGGTARPSHDFYQSEFNVIRFSQSLIQAEYATMGINFGWLVRPRFVNFKFPCLPFLVIKLSDHQILNA